MLVTPGQARQHSWTHWTHCDTLATAAVQIAFFAFWTVELVETGIQRLIQRAQKRSD